MVFLSSSIEYFRVFILLLSVVYTVYNLIKTSTIFTRRKKKTILHIHITSLTLERKRTGGK